jgi:hypothetical protein
MGTQCLRYSWVILSPGVTNMDAWSTRLGVGLTAPPCKNPVVRKAKEGIETSKEGYGS